MFIEIQKASVILAFSYNNIGWICSLSNATSIVFIIYSGSKTIERGLVIGLSCLNGTK